MCKTRKTLSQKLCKLHSVRSKIVLPLQTSPKTGLRNCAKFGENTLLKLIQEVIPELLNSAEIEIFGVHLTSKKCLRDPLQLVLHVVLKYLRNRC